MSVDPTSYDTTSEMPQSRKMTVTMTYSMDDKFPRYVQLVDAEWLAKLIKENERLKKQLKKRVLPI